MKNHLIPLPVPGEPDLFRIRFAGAGYQGPREECDRVAAGIRTMAEGLAGERAVAEVRQAEYAEHWAPKMRGRTIPKYVPAWAVEMHQRAAE